MLVNMEVIVADQMLQNEELESLEAIYDNDFRLCDDTGKHCVNITIRPDIDSPDHEYTLVPLLTTELQIILPDTYPSQVPPVLEIKSDYLNEKDLKNIYDSCSQLFSTGDVIIYQWVECVKDYLNNKASTIIEEMELALKSTERELTQQNTKQEHLSEDLTHDSQSLSCDLIKTSLDDKMTKKPSIESKVESESIIHGEPLTDRKSTFQAHVAEVHSMDEVERLLSVLKSNRKIAVATHNILAYRYFDEVKGVVIQDCDDDGESAAGGRLLHLLQIMDVLNIMVVVSRWYGGIHLGPDRFKHINNVARVLLQHTGIGSKGLTENQGNQKRKLKKRL